MKLEDLTKDELIEFMRKDWLLNRRKEKSIVRDCLWNRMSKIEKEMYDASDKVIDLSQKYSDFLKPYKTLADIPENELQKGVKIERALKQARADEEKTRKQYDKLSKLLIE